MNIENFNLTLKSVQIIKSTERNKVWIYFQVGKSQRSGLRIMKSQKIQAIVQAPVTCLWCNKNRSNKWSCLTFLNVLHFLHVLWLIIPSLLVLYLILIKCCDKMHKRNMYVCSPLTLKLHQQKQISCLTFIPKCSEISCKTANTEKALLKQRNYPCYFYPHSSWQCTKGSTKCPAAWHCTISEKMRPRVRKHQNYHPGEKKRKHLWVHQREGPLRQTTEWIPQRHLSRRTQRAVRKRKRYHGWLTPSMRCIIHREKMWMILRNYEWLAKASMKDSQRRGSDHRVIIKCSVWLV